MYLTSNIPYFKCWVRKEFTNGHQNYHGEYIHGLAVAVTTIPDRCLSFKSSSQVAKPMTAVRKMFMVGPCGQECLLPLLWVTSRWSNGPSVCQRILRNLGTVARTTTGFLRSKGRNLRRGCARLITSSMLEGTYLRSIMPRVMFQKTPPSINRAMY
jgi:hypothetical protein